MIVFPNCKINLGLNILQKRTDGYHDIDTVFYPVPLTDALEIVEYKELQRSTSIPFTVSGQSIEGDTASNLCLNAYRLLKKDFPEIPHIQMHLHKVIPSGAGLGGGSADAAFTLTLLNDLFLLELSKKQLIGYAAQLGSDCPFFILNTPCLASGRGEILEEIKLDLSNYKLVIVNPGIHINTGDAFRKLRPRFPGNALKDMIVQPVHLWKHGVYNDFEKIIFTQYPAVADIKDHLYRNGALYASMSGSGSSVFGLFNKDQPVTLSFPADYFIKEFLLH